MNAQAGRNDRLDIAQCFEVQGIDRQQLGAAPLDEIPPLIFSVQKQFLRQLQLLD